jgi:hypothetical protein
LMADGSTTCLPACISICKTINFGAPITHELPPQSKKIVDAAAEEGWGTPGAGKPLAASRSCP